MKDFFARVYKIVSKIPEGKVATYGQIALLLGEPRSARIVGWAMKAAPENLRLPCHRVVNRFGEMAPDYAFGSSDIQRAILTSEGITFNEEGRIDMKKHLWHGTDNNEIVDDFNTLISFLAKRDIGELSKDQLFNNFKIKQADLLIILGSGIPFIAEEGARAYKNGIAKEIMIVGGIGHSTKYLAYNISNSDRYRGIAVNSRAEADILKDVLVKCEGIIGSRIIVENKSTNCGANAHEALKVINDSGKKYKTVILLQDPTMQLRTYASFSKEWSEKETIFINYSPFIPLLKKLGDSFDYINKDIYGLWHTDRFISLIMGEIPRLRDDEDGYGPRGKGYIGHVDIPEAVMSAYRRLTPFYGEYTEMRNNLS